MTLYEMTEAARQLKALLESDEIDEQIFNDTIESIGAGEKIDAYCKIIREYEAEIAERKSEIERLRTANDRAEKAIDRMKSALDGFMTASGQRTKPKSRNISPTAARWKALRSSRAETFR